MTKIQARAILSKYLDETKKHSLTDKITMPIYDDIVLTDENFKQWTFRSLLCKAYDLEVGDINF
jgi:hypothetical protein